MRRLHLWRPFTIAAALLSFAHFAERPVPTVHAVGNTYSVNVGTDESDLNTADGVCNIGGNACTLRAAIEQANATAGPDTIENVITGPAGSTVTVQPLTQLPAITDPVVIDLSAPTLNGRPFILNGALAPAGTDGLRVGAGATPTTIRDFTINGFDGAGLRIGNTTGVQVYGMRIGTNHLGDTAVANRVGILINEAPENTIGGFVAADRNLISGNTADGVRITGNASTENVLQGNLIGLDVTGTLGLGNGGNGVHITNGQANLVGNIDTGGRNVISANGANGVLVDGANAGQNSVGNSFIGTDVTGTNPLGNTAAGVRLEGGNSNGAEVNRIAYNGASGVIINEDFAGVVDNIIRDNQGDGVRVLSGVSSTITGNSIRDNAGLGIDLQPNGPNANDPLDTDTGPNELQNHPVINAVSIDGAITIYGTISSTPITGFSIDFFSSPACDPSGYGEGATYLDTYPTAGTTIFGTGTFSFVIAGPLAPGDVITATATRSTGSTSEFSPCFTVGPAGDDDNDGVPDVSDNCPIAANASQLNTDAAPFPTSGLPNDVTRPNGDLLGDVCDNDDDNDGIVDANEATGTSCALPDVPTDPLLLDTDGDRVTDGAECFLGTDPTDALSKPLAVPPGDTDGDGLASATEGVLGSDPNIPDTDGDGITDGIEYKGYGTSPLLTNTDGDTGPLSQPCNDGREVAAVDSNTVVNSNDLLIVAQSFGAADRPNMDANKNGVINSGDLLLVAGQFVVTPC